MSATYLDGIVAFHRRRASLDQRDWRDRDVAPSARASLRSSLLAHRDAGLSVIAEIKRRSPSKGWLAPDLDASATARVYESAGATAISVLTDEPHFGGTLGDLADVARTVTVPLLRKDFTVAPNDVVDAVENGASAILLIVAVLSSKELSELLAVARHFQLDALVEVHTSQEAQCAVDVGADVIGVNQRDLHTFDVDATRAESVVAKLPASIVTVAESGISTVESAVRASQAGFDAILVGEHFVTAPDPAEAVASFVGHPSRVRLS